jgi:hypothetical protein
MVKEIYLEEAAEIALINSLAPQFWGTYKVGGHPQTPGRRYPAPLFQRYPELGAMMLILTE